MSRARFSCEISKMFPLFSCSVMSHIKKIYSTLICAHISKMMCSLSISSLFQTVVAASDLESVEGRESPRTDRSEKAETGYFSGSLSSTPNQLSSLDDMILAESPTFIDYHDNDAFKQDRVLDMFSNGKTTDAARSRSDPMPTSALTKEQPNLVPSVVSDVIESQWTSNSEPNLVSRNIASSPKPKRSISSQEVPVEVKEVVKDRTPSTESSGSLLSPVGSPFDQPVFSHNRTDSQKSFSSTSTVPASPVALASLPLPKAKQKPVSFPYFTECSYKMCSQLGMFPCLFYVIC